MGMQYIHTDQLVDLNEDRYLDSETEGRRENVAELAASIAELGVLTPLTVIPQKDGHWGITAGHRRRAAAVMASQMVLNTPEHYNLSPEQAKTRAEELLRLPCFERADLARPGWDVLAQIAENGQRRDLDDATIAQGLQLALLDGVPVHTVVQATGINHKTVRAAGKITALPPIAQSALSAGQLNLDEAVQLVEFADDPKALERIVRSSHREFAVAVERSRRAVKLARRVLKQQLTDAGFTVISRPRAFPYASQAAALDTLADDGIQLDKHDAQPVEGHAVFIESRTDTGSAEAIHVCLDPETHGHARLTPTQYVTEEETARREAERRAAEEKAEHMHAARQVRHTFLATLYSSQKAASRHGNILVTVAACWPYLLSGGARRRAENVEPDQGMTQARLHQLALESAVHGIDTEAELEPRWSGHNTAPALWWWNTLAELGYRLSSIEETHRDNLLSWDNAQQATDANDDSEDGKYEDSGLDREEADAKAIDEPGHEARDVKTLHLVSTKQ